MRIKFLSVIASLFIMSVAITACLDNEDNIEYSPDATIHAFSLEPVLGKDYKFTIDQIKGEIYNLDSMPMNADTVINKILIDTLSVAGFVTSKATTEGAQDTLLNIQDSINFLGTMETPYIFKVWAPDLSHSKEYKISVRIHRQDPDSLNWGTAPIAVNPAEGKQKAVILNNKIYNFEEGNATTVYTTVISDGKKWEEVRLSGFPQDFKLSSILQFDSKLYVATKGGEVYNSSNGTAWTKHEGLSTGNVYTLIASFPSKSQGDLTDIKGISAIINEQGRMKFAKTNKELTGWEEGINNVVPSNFPTEYFSSETYTTEVQIPNAVLVGNSQESAPNDTATVIWASENGINWNEITNGDAKYKCPKVENPTIIKYGDAFYIFGKGFESFYTSPNLLVWKEVKDKFLFPKTLKGKETEYSFVVDENHFMWLMCSSPAAEIWRGRLNRLGFIRQ